MEDNQGDNAILSLSLSLTLTLFIYAKDMSTLVSSYSIFVYITNTTKLRELNYHGCKSLANLIYKIGVNN